MTLDLSAQLEAILFFTGDTLTIRELSRMLKTTEDAVRKGLEELAEKLRGRGVTLMRNDNEVRLATAPETSDLITQIRKEELEKDIGKAGLETLAIILYQGPVTRARIDYVRGVNSAFIVRQLMVRGLIERVDNPDDARSFLYKPTLELVSFLGLSSTSDLPDMQAIKEELASFEMRRDETESRPENNASTESSQHTDTA